MKHRVVWSPAESAPPRVEVLRLQGIPVEGGLSPRTAALLGRAFAEYLDATEPRAILGEVSREAFAALYRGEGRNAPDTPLEAIVPRAERLALFTATVGERVTRRIRDLFDRHELALGAMLDSVASAAADHLAGLLGPCFLALAGLEPANGARVLAYSPGYCGWHVSGQRALFAALEPEAIGVTLNASFLMQPLKSVSGVLVAGPGRIHRFAADYPFCGDCPERPCRERIASVLGDRDHEGAGRGPRAGEGS
jgi:hypothetical protein